MRLTPKRSMHSHEVNSMQHTDFNILKCIKLFFFFEHTRMVPLFIEEDALLQL